MKIFALAAIIIMPFFSAPSFSAVYPIVERDMLEELREALAKVDYKKYLTAYRDKLFDSKGVILTKAKDNNTRIIDTTYTLDRDIPRVNEKGEVIGVLYPKGYTFNPVDYSLILPPPMIIFNACDKAERGEVEKLSKIKGYEYSILVSSGCPVKEFKPISGKEIKLLYKRQAEEFKLRHTISVVFVNKEKRGYEVNEIAVSR